MQRILVALGLVMLAPGALAELPPAAPAGLEATYDDVAQSVSLTWLADAAADAYNVYRNGELLATVETASFVDGALPEVQGMVYAVTAVRHVAESPPATIGVVALTVQEPKWLAVKTLNPQIPVIIFGNNPCPPIGLGLAPPAWQIAWDCLPTPPTPPLLEG